MNRGWGERFRDVRSSLRRLQLIGSEEMSPQQEGDLEEEAVEAQAGQVIEPETPDVFLTEPPDIPYNIVQKELLPKWKTESDPDPEPNLNPDLTLLINRTDEEFLEGDKPFFRDSFGLDIGDRIGSGHNATVYGGVVISDRIRKLYRVYEDLDPNAIQLYGETVVWIKEGNKPSKPYIERKLEKKRFAVKLVLGDKLLARELELLSSLEHQNIVDIYHVGNISSPFLVKTWPNRSVRIYIFMELADYGSLENFFTNRNQICTGQMCLSFTNQIIDGLSYLQSLNICHRSFRSDNILVFNGNVRHEYILKISDFGGSAIQRGGRRNKGFLPDMVGLGEILKFEEELNTLSDIYPAMCDITKRLGRKEFLNCEELRTYMSAAYPEYFPENDPLEIQLLF